ncbi:MAG: hypothetical protein KKF46_05475 [Nanoarchaeota archaeon]|nr:hypothetical protein [Nanoarchaeota archaeon]MBU1321783.1 hypothetical protein [Nanoarchaeota archaeon]MBU1598482.1 hypothetical protein [Nanoarchaeota archaeon]MBU2440816.1 hypothetical protein [Nanoarchaeota archaeon]
MADNEKMSNEEPILVFDDTSKSRLLKALGFKVEKSDILDEKGKLLTNPDFEVIPNNNFGGFLKGSKIAIKKEESELVKYFSGLD